MPGQSFLSCERIRKSSSSAMQSGSLGPSSFCLQLAGASQAHQVRSQGAGIFVIHIAVRFIRARPQALWIFQPMVDPCRIEARTNLREGWSNVALVYFCVDDVTRLTGV